MIFKKMDAIMCVCVFIRVCFLFQNAHKQIKPIITANQSQEQEEINNNCIWSVVS